MPRTSTIGKYLIQRLEQLKLKHVFGIPGDYVLGFYDMLGHSKQIKVIGTCDEQGAGFAADGYARVNGLGCVCITYCVGGLKTVNAVAGAYAEKSPLIVISGSPGMGERAHAPMLHHMVRDFHTQLSVYEKITAAAVALEDPLTAAADIDHCIETCLRTKRPVYLEIPRDMVHTKIRVPDRPVTTPTEHDPRVLKEAAGEAIEMLKHAKNPVILAGVEIHRFGLQDELLKLVEKTGMPIAATLLGKSVIREDHGQYLGVYEGAMGRDAVRKAVEDADAVLILGAFMTDMNLGIFTANLDTAKTINANSERTSISHHHFDALDLKQFMAALTRPKWTKPKTKVKPPAAKPFKPRPNEPVTVKRFFLRMNRFLAECKDMMVVCDIGDALFGAADLTIQRRTDFLAPAYYTSMGFAVPAALGAQMNNPKVRPVVFVGDGAFQMTGQELSIIARHGLNPIIIVINNKGYTTERFIHEGPFNDIHDWAYHLLPQVYRRGWGCEVHTEGELENALVQARNNQTSFSLLNVHTGKMDTSDALVRLGERLGARVGAKKTAAKKSAAKRKK